MAERYVREVTRDDTHLADVKGTPGAHRGLEYDDDNNLVAHAEYYPVDEEVIIAAFSVRDSASHRCACPLSVGVRR